MRARIAALLLATLAPIGTAAAQTPGFSLMPGVDTPRGEIAGAVSLNGFTDVNTRPSCEELALPCTSPKTFPDFGWALSGARSITDWLAITGEFAGAHNLWYSAPHAAAPDVNHIYSLMAGPRVATPFLHKSGIDPLDFRVFGQVLLGVQVAEVVEGGRAIRPGAGLDVHTASGVIVRAQVDYCFVRDGGERRSISGGRWLIGLVLGID